MTADRATDAHTFADGWFMIAGGDQGDEGCWRVTAEYRDAELSYVYLVAPTGWLRAATRLVWLTAGVVR